MLVLAGMNSAVRAIVRMGIYLGCKVYLIKEVCIYSNSLEDSLLSGLSAMFGFLDVLV